MKRTYLQPELVSNETQASQMMAVSIVDGDADPSKPILTKEDKNWDIWNDEAE